MPEVEPSSPPVAPAPPVEMRSDRTTRIGSGIAAIACLAVLITAAVLTPSAEGHGTHTRLGLPSCQWVQMFDQPCATCGMTTSFSHAANCSLGSAATTQPFGAMLAVLTAAVFWGTLHTAATGVRVADIAMRFVTGRTLLVGLALLLAAWVYKIVTWN